MENDDPSIPNQPLIFPSDWSVETIQASIREQEENFEHADGRQTPAELLLLSVAKDGRINVGIFEERSAKPGNPIVLVSDLPDNSDDQQEFALGLTKKGLEPRYFTNLFLRNKPVKLLVCRSNPELVPATPPPTPSPVPGPAPAQKSLISEDAMALILEFEGVDQPGKWPGASSGISLGVGYDLGFVDSQRFVEDWGRHLTESQVARLKTAIGKKGQAAKAIASRFLDIKITRSMGEEVFNRSTLPRFVALTNKIFKMAGLPPNAQGALVSLVFNRGSQLTGPTRREMNAIHDILKNANFPNDLSSVLPKIAREIRSMKRLWDINTLRGLHRRRDAEASMIENAVAKPGTFGPATGSFPAAPAPAPANGRSGVTGEALVAIALPHCNCGERYKLGAFVPKDDPTPKPEWDCAEFVSWCVYQVAGILVGCENNKAKPSLADAYTGYWERDCNTDLVAKISVEEAAAIPGAIILRYPPKGGIGHIVLSDGEGGTLEAKGAKFGVVTDQIAGRRWSTGLLVKGITYTRGNDPIADVARSPKVYFAGAPGMDPNVVKAIQKRLTDLRFDTGGVDGDFGEITSSAVLAFQASRNLTVDGEVGPETAAALGVQLT